MIATRALGYRFRTEEARMVLQPVADLLRVPGRVCDRVPASSPEPSPEPSPSSFIYASPDASPGPSPEALKIESGTESRDSSGPFSPPHPLSIVDVREEEDDARAHESQGKDELTLSARAQLLCARAADVAVNIGSLPVEIDVRAFVAANANAAERLIGQYGEAAVMERWRKMLDDVHLGHLEHAKITMPFLLRIWERTVAIEQRRSGLLVPVDSKRTDAKVDAAAQSFFDRLKAHGG
jgi:hypothetical protein